MCDLFHSLLQQAEEIQHNSLAANTNECYKSSMNVYQRVMFEELNVSPFPIDIDKIQVFLMFQWKHKNRTKNTLLGYINAFSRYFKENNLEILTNDIKFKIFKQGLKRSFKTNSDPFQKAPFQIMWFKKILEKFPVFLQDSCLFMLFLTLSFQFFLRIDELTNLKKSDIKFDSNQGKLDVLIRYSKTDQEGESITMSCWKTDDINNPINYLEALQALDEHQKICAISKTALRSHLRFVLKTIGVDDFNNYSFHSLRREAVYLASIQGVPDCVI